jgi:hypothetical protein
MAVRASLGGSRLRLIRQLLTESFLLALAGGMTGLVLAAWSMDFLNVIELPLPFQVAIGLRLDWRVFTFTLAASVATAMIFGLFPALQASKTNLSSTLKDQSFSLGGSRRGSYLRGSLIAGQVALSLPSQERRLIDSSDVWPGYFVAMGIALLEGRDFLDSDRDRSMKTAIINESMAKRYWPNRSPIGHRIYVEAGNGAMGPLEIVGVVRDGKYRTLGEQPRPYVYGNLAQGYAGGGILVARASGDIQPVLSGIRNIVRTLDPNLPVSLMPMTERMGVSLLLPRYAALLFGAFGALGFLLSLSGSTESSPVQLASGHAKSGYEWPWEEQERTF